MKVLALVCIIGALVLGTSAQYTFPDICQWEGQVKNNLIKFVLLLY